MSLRRATRLLSQWRAETRLLAQIEAISSEWERTGRPNHSYLAGFRGRRQLHRVREHYRDSLARMIPSFSTTRGVDLGCWHGLSTLVIHSLGCQSVVGAEVNPRFFESAAAWRKYFDLDGLSFLPIEHNRLPLESGSQDWVMINHVLCNALANSFDGTLREAARVLRHDGVLVFCDANNPYCPSAVQRLEKRYQEAELGQGTSDAPRGKNFARRRLQLSRALPKASDEDLDRLARDTCYLFGEQIEQAARDFAKTGETPESRFEPGLDRTPCNPMNGSAHGNVTDPYDVRDQIAALGFETTVAVRPTWKESNPEKLAGELARSEDFFVFARKS